MTTEPDLVARLVGAAVARPLLVVVGDRGNAESRAADRLPDLESGRGVGLQAAHSRLTAIGGDLTISPAPWGGTSVTVRVPI